MAASHRRDVSLFDRVGRWYDLFVPAADAERLRAGLALAERDVQRVLDLAGGTGRGARALDAPERVVVDAARGMLRPVDADLSAVQADATRLPFRDESADAAAFVDSLHHVPDHPAALAEISRVLRPGGVVVIQEFDPATVRGRLLAAGEHLLGFDSRFHGPHELGGLLRDAGLVPRVVESRFDYTVVGRKPRDDASSRGGDGRVLPTDGARRFRSSTESEREGGPGSRPQRRR